MAQSGTYILLLHLPLNTPLQIGKLGQFNFPAGFYTYVGSAFGSGGLAGRLKHHLSPVKKAHWHIDYFRTAAQVIEVWLSTNTVHREHEWADLLLAIPGASVLVDKFGASDCQCDSHLIYFELKPDIEDFIILSQRRFPDDIVIKAFNKKEAHEQNN